MPGQRPLTILVAEDDALIAELLSEMLGAMGHMVCAIEATEAGAVEAARRHEPDLMIMDLQLGRGSGVDAIDQVNKTRAIASILVSGDIARARALRPEAILLEKPYTQKTLASAILRASAL